MFNFTFQNPTKVIFGNETIGQIAHEIPRNAHVLITYGAQSARKYGVRDEVVAALHGHDITEFGGIEPNPEYETLLKGIALAREKNIEIIRLLEAHALLI